MGGSGYDGGVGGWFHELRTGVDAAPTPQVTSHPPAEVLATPWQSPDLSAKGHLVVHTDHLEQESGAIRACLADVRSAIAEIQQHQGSFGSLAGWPQGREMCQTLLASIDSFAQVAQQTHDAHAETAGNLRASAHAYTDAETRNTAAAKSVGAQNGGWNA